MKVKKRRIIFKETKEKSKPVSGLPKSIVKNLIKNGEYYE